MGKGFKIGTIIGIPIRIDYSWFIIFLLISLSLSLGFFPSALPHMSVFLHLVLGFVTAVLFFASVLLHELSHSYVAIRRGLPVSAITLFVFGGVSMLEEEPQTPRIELQMSIVGPLTSMILAGVFYAAARWLEPTKSYLWVIATQLWWVNLAVGAFNLLPGFPLDGGRVLRSIVWHFTGDLRRATFVAALAGQGFAYMLIVLGILSFFTGGVMGGIWLAFIGWFLLTGAQSSYQQMLIRQLLSGVPVGSLPLAEAVKVEPDTRVQELVHDYMLRRSENVFPVQSNGRLLGVVGLHEIQSLPRDQWPVASVKEIMRPIRDEEKTRSDADAWDAVQHLRQTDCECQFVVDGDELKGILTRGSLVHWMQTMRDLHLRD